MTCGRTDHTKFASAPRAESFAAPEKEGTYDNRRTFCRETWHWNQLTKKTELAYSVSAEAIMRRGAGYERRPWGDYPDIPRGGEL